MGIKKRFMVNTYWIDEALQIFLYLILVAGALVLVFPFLWMIFSAFKSSKELFQVPPTFFPHQPTLRNFYQLLEFVPYWRQIFNSFIVATSITLGVLFTSSLAGYIFSKFDFPGKNILFVLVLTTLMVPFPVIAVPLYLLVSFLRWIDTYQGLIGPGLVSAFGTFLMRQYIHNIPGDYMEAARIDGLSEFGIYVKIILPMIKPALSALAILTFLFQWGTLLWPLLVVNSETMKTLPLGIAGLTHSRGARYDLQMAASCGLVLPVLIFFLVAQRRFIKSIQLSGLKG